MKTDSLMQKDVNEKLNWNPSAVHENVTVSYPNESEKFDTGFPHKDSFSSNLDVESTTSGKSEPSDIEAAFLNLRQHSFQKSCRSLLEHYKKQVT